MSKEVHNANRKKLLTSQRHQDSECTPKSWRWGRAVLGSLTHTIVFQLVCKCLMFDTQGKSHT